MKTSAIVAMGTNRVIGINNDLPWRLSSDLKYFKKQTMGHHMIMGRKCFDSIGKPLPGRTTVILSRNPDLKVEGCIVKNDLEDALREIRSKGESEVFIVGGAEIYKLTAHLWDKLYVTFVDFDKEGDAYFPEVNFDEWQIIMNEPRKKDEKNPYNHTFRQFIREHNT